MTPSAQVFQYASDKPMAYLTSQIPTEKLHDFLKRFQEKNRSMLSLADVIIYSICQSLKSFPEFNSAYSGNIIRTFPEINLGYFINLGQGIQMATLQNANQLSLLDFSKEMKNLALRSLRGELSDNEVQKSTFAVTNLSSFGVHFLHSPVLTHHSVMFSLGKEFTELCLQEGLPTEQRKIHLTLSFDARIADCQRALVFLRAVQTLLENLEKSET